MYIYIYIYACTSTDMFIAGYHDCYYCLVMITIIIIILVMIGTKREVFDIIQYLGVFAVASFLHLLGFSLNPVQSLPLILKKFEKGFPSLAYKGTPLDISVKNKKVINNFNFTSTKYYLIKTKYSVN